MLAFPVPLVWASQRQPGQSLKPLAIRMFGGVPRIRTLIGHAMGGRKFGPPLRYMEIIGRKGQTTTSLSPPIRHYRAS